MNLKELIARPTPEAPMITIFGEGGTGKTLLASTFPAPVFIRAEDGFDVFAGRAKAPHSFPVLQTGIDIFDQLEALLEQEHPFKTLVIDSITSLNKLFEAYIVAKDPKAVSMATADGGYGKGFEHLAMLNARVKKMADALRSEKGMAVVFLGHVELEKLDLPDEENYSRFSMSIHKKSIGFYTDFVSLVGLLKLQTIVNKETGKVRSFGDRVMICDKRASSIAKNRYGITDELEVPEGENPLLSIIPFFKTTSKE